MPYISTDSVKAIRNELKIKIPEAKLTIRREHHMKVIATLKAAPYDFNPTDYVNVYYIKERYDVVKAELLERIINCLNMFQGEAHEDSDYGWIPTYYIDIVISDNYKQTAK